MQLHVIVREMKSQSQSRDLCFVVKKSVSKWWRRNEKFKYYRKFIFKNLKDNLLKVRRILEQNDKVNDTLSFAKVNIKSSLAGIKNIIILKRLERLEYGRSIRVKWLMVVKNNRFELRSDYGRRIAFSHVC